eukprot:6237689-Amphidinium_carterae.1
MMPSQCRLTVCIACCGSRICTQAPMPNVCALIEFDMDNRQQHMQIVARCSDARLIRITMELKTLKTLFVLRLVNLSLQGVGIDKIWVCVFEKICCNLTLNCKHTCCFNFFFEANGPTPAGPGKRLNLHLSKACTAQVFIAATTTGCLEGFGWAMKVVNKHLYHAHLCGLEWCALG